MYWLSLLKIFIISETQSTELLKTTTNDLILAQQEDEIIQKEINEFIKIKQDKKIKRFENDELFWRAMRESLRKLDQSLPVLSDSEESDD